ncbi:MAG TPA: hypothetical protein VKP59_02985 [Candidatus Thermoplasmatota archaeon]|nr:hypothetical protein [Candidatus Thermoplasmatota archaeon]
MNKLWKKTIVLGIFALFLGMTLAPTLSAAHRHEAEKKEQMKYTTLVDYQNFQVDDKNDIESFQNKIQSFLLNLNTRQNDDGLKEILEKLLDWLINKSDNPLISVLLSKLLNLERLKNKEIVISAGWGYDINPLKKTEVKIVKPLSLWKYTDTSEKMSMPSVTVLISGDPMKVETVVGNQLGFMYRFRGIYGHIPQQFPEQSFTYMIGTTQNAAALELPTMDLFAS